PGDLFTVRNVGNLVPRAGSDPCDDSIASAVEFATGILNVHTITVCGHSGCGAMAALLDGPATTAHLRHLGRWLRHGDSSLALLDDGADGDDPGTRLDRLCRLNIRQQLANLRTYPAVDEQVQAGTLKLMGLYFDIGSARVEVVRPGAPGSPATATTLAAEPEPR
ncbi:carbonic anhydrase, partial [Spongiactinospora rosea]